jgi:adenylate kinase
MKVVVAALPGSGKSTIMELVKKKMPSVRVVNVGDMIRELAEKEIKLKDRDELRKKLTLEQQRRFQEIVAKKIARMKDKNIVIDTHTSVKTPNGFFPGLSEKTAHLIKPDAIVLLEYRPEDVIVRRKKDPTRRRDDDSVEILKAHQESTRQFAFEAAEHVEAYVKVIDLTFREKKPFDHTEIAAKEIIKLFKQQQK